MQRVYLLLRNNQQSGPFTIAELLQQQLKPSDMLWVEGRSATWTYLSEMELQASTEISPTNTKAETKINLSQPDEIEKKAEELRQKVLSFTASPDFNVNGFDNNNISSTANKFAIASTEEEEPVIRFHDRRKEKKMIMSELAMTFIVIALFGAIFYGGKSMFNQKKANSYDEVVTAISTEENTAKKTEQPVQQNLLVQKTPTAIVNDSAEEIKKTPVIKKRPVAKKPSQVQTIESTVLPIPDKVETPPLQTQEKTVQHEIVNEEKPIAEVKEEPTKKKTLGQAIRGLFRKKKKD